MLVELRVTVGNEVARPRLLTKYKSHRVREGAFVKHSNLGALA